MLMSDKLVKPKTKNDAKSRNLFLGVDGGGTKTTAILLDESLKIVGEGRSDTSNPLRVGIETSVANIFFAAQKACDDRDKSMGDIVSGVFGLAGVRREDLRQSMKRKLSSRLKIKLIDVVTDAEIALYGSTDGKAGLVVIAGTGSICCGRDDLGNVAMAGGWGPIAGDEGGGAGIARNALRAIAKASDGRAPETKLSEMACDYFRADTPQDVALAIYAPSMTNARMAGFAKFVAQAAREGDAVAIEILDEAGCELGLAANAVIRKLKLEGLKIPISRVGSIWNAKEFIEKPFLKKVKETAKGFLIEPKFSPPIAAARMAHTLT